MDTYAKGLVAFGVVCQTHGLNEDEAATAVTGGSTWAWDEVVSVGAGSGFFEVFLRTSCLL